MFNGAPDRYDWKLIGKKELYIPYNAYRLDSPQLKYSDIIKPGHINRDLTRYELHRVWEVEATLKTGERHIYAKRHFFIDEDTGRLQWSIITTVAISSGAWPKPTACTSTMCRFRCTPWRPSTTSFPAAIWSWA